MTTKNFASKASLSTGGTKCTSCKYCISWDYGYSNYTVEGTEVDCLLHLNPKFPADNFYGEGESLLFANECNSYKKGECVELDVNMEGGDITNYSSNKEIKKLLKEYSIKEGWEK